MARILIGWELGSGRGHAENLIDLATEMRARGHDPVLAVQQTAAMPAGFEIWQAPLWPALITSRARPSRSAPATFGDILSAVGLGEAGVLSGLIRAWDRILAAVRPDAVAAEFAPALLPAARGRVPLLSFGTGFAQPPAGLAAFPSLTGDPAARDEAALLAVANREIGLAGAAPLPALPALFAADRVLVQAFPLLDPYRHWRQEGEYAPPPVSAATGNLPPLADGRGEEIFVYLNGAQTVRAPLLAGMVDAGLPIRLHMPNIADADAAVLEQAGITVERLPVPIARIVERSRLIVSHGGIGLAAAALCAGLPHIVLSFDLEKRLTGLALAEAGLGRQAEFRALDRPGMARLLAEGFADGAMAARCRDAAPAFRSAAVPGGARAVADAVEALIAA